MIRWGLRLCALGATLMALAMLGTEPATGSSVIFYDDHRVGWRWNVDGMAAAWSANGDVVLQEVDSCDQVAGYCIDVRGRVMERGYLGLTYVNSQEATIYVNRLHKYDPKCVRWQATAHELGHALGLGHSEGWTVMESYATGEPCAPTDRDLRDVLERW